jgi:branched-chain amino acid transport system permease protein
VSRLLRVLGARHRFVAHYRDELGLRPSPAEWAGIAAAAAFLTYLPTAVENQSFLGLQLPFIGVTTTQLDLALIAIMGAVGLNFLSGSGGLVSIGNAAFLALGGMVSAFVSVQHNFPFAVALCASGLAGAIVGVLIGLPALRVRGIYLITVTLALQFVMANLFLAYQVRVFGASGIAFPSPSVGPIVIRSDVDWYRLLLVLDTLTVLAVYNILRTRPGRALVAVRDHELAAASAGINVAFVKVQAFAVSSGIISVAGSLYAYYLSNATSEIYTLNLSLQFIAMIIWGGLGSLLGSILGATVWQMLPAIVSNLSQLFVSANGGGGEALRANVGNITNIIFGVLLIGVLLSGRKGLAGLWGSAVNAAKKWPFRD